MLRCILLMTSWNSFHRYEVQVWAKPQPSGRVAVLVINSNQDSVRNATVELSKLNLTGTVHVRSIWDHTDKGTVTDALTTGAIPPADSRFYLLSPSFWKKVKSKKEGVNLGEHLVSCIYIYIYYICRWVAFCEIFAYLILIVLLYGLIYHLLPSTFRFICC